MANALPAINNTIYNEGLYSNDVGDSGKETVLGLTRAYDADWEGWALVDKYRNKPNFPHNLVGIQQQLHALAVPFYKKKYWDVIRGDEIHDQEEAQRIYDMEVNKDTTAIVLAQRVLHLPETGHMDDITLNKLNNES
jgi:lysozyme family protein